MRESRGNNKYKQLLYIFQYFNEFFHLTAGLFLIGLKMSIAKP